MPRLFSNRSKWENFLLGQKKRLLPSIEFNITSKNVTRYGLSSTEEAWKNENPRKLFVDNENAVDLINVWGSDEAGNTLMLRMARRPDRRAELWIYLRLASSGAPVPSNTWRAYAFPLLPDLQIYHTDGKSFSAKGLHFEVLEPLKSMRIRFNGHLRRVPDMDRNQIEEELAHVEFNFIWHPMYSYSVYPNDFDPTLMAKFFSGVPWTRETEDTWCISPVDCHEQWGQLHGTVAVNELQEELRLTGTKLREFGTLDYKAIERKLVIKGIDKRSNAFTLYGAVDSEGVIRIYHGLYAHPSMMGLFPVTKCKAVVPNFALSTTGFGWFFHIESTANEVVNVDFIAGNAPHRCKIDTQGARFIFYGGENNEVRGSCQRVPMKMNGVAGFCYIETYETYTGGSYKVRPPPVQLLIEPAIHATTNLVLALTDTECRSSAVVGGKGAYLALLATMVTDDIGFSVPKGLCLSKLCFERHMADYPEIKEAIDGIERAAWRTPRIEEDVTRACTRAYNSVIKNHISDAIRSEIHTVLDKLFDDPETVRYSVRSSAVGEDSAHTPPSGPDSTLIILNHHLWMWESFAKCWGNQFLAPAVKYRIQHGQPLNPGMGVVIQELILSEVGGILYSNDRRTTSLAVMSVSASYGLAESVFSGIDCDVFTLSRTYDDQVTIVDRHLGAKETRTEIGDVKVLDVLTVENSEEQRTKFCISDEMVLRLANIGIEIGKAYGSPRDVEWAIRGNDIYVLQTRPTTSNSEFTDFEVQHEFDTALRPEDHLSPGNAPFSEVMPGALSPLSLTSFVRMHAINFQDMFMGSLLRFDPSVLQGTAIYKNHVFSDMVQQRAWRVTQPVRDMESRTAEFAMLGKVVDEVDIMFAAKDRYTKNQAISLRKIMSIWLSRGKWRSNSVLSEMERRFGAYPNIIETGDSPSEAYTKIANRILDIPEAIRSHLTVTIGTNFWNGLVLSWAAAGADPFTSVHCADFATLLGSSIGTDSGDVPIRLQEIAEAIVKDFKNVNFGALPTEEALELLNGEDSDAKVKFQEFLNRHGHRGPQEMEFKSKSWKSNPSSVIRIIQAMTRNPRPLTRTAATTTWSALRRLRTHINYFNKSILLVIVNLSRRAICNRERSKSLLVQLLNNFRTAFHNLSVLLVESGYIPDAELMFFMTFEEIDQLIKTRSASIVARANRRMELYPAMDSLIFPDLVVGTPVHKTRTQAFRSIYTLNGVTACDGDATGHARVINFDEADTIQLDDILITHSMDIAWCPYFPMLAGVVTEVGGIGSHGAILAREYGLPCIVGATDAMSVFRTGDRVVLEAANGRIFRDREQMLV